jgi:hypothetical protein
MEAVDYLMEKKKEAENKKELKKRGETKPLLYKKKGSN